jgi:hypothetical protein
MRTTGFFAGALCALSSFCSTVVHAEPTFSCAGHEPSRVSVGAAAKPLVNSRRALPSHGTVNVLVIFAKFKNEAPGKNQAPDFADDLFDPDLPGSFTHFYDTMSFGQLRIQGTVLQKRYVSDEVAKEYEARNLLEHGGYNRFAREILRQVDADYDLGQFDNDGPDGIPNSGDDDGVVDYVFINMRSVPHRFIIGKATGIARLDPDDEEVYRSEDASPNGKFIRIRIVDLTTFPFRGVDS